MRYAAGIGPPDVVKATCPVRGALGGNPLSQGSKDAVLRLHQLLAYITRTVDQDLLLRNEYLVTENRILHNQIKGRVRLSDGERRTLAEICQKLGKQALAEAAKIVKPDTILGWHCTLVAQKCDGSQQRKAAGRPTIDQEVEALVVRMARENAPGATTGSWALWPTWDTL